jgi:hypothetical protein
LTFLALGTYSVDYTGLCEEVMEISKAKTKAEELVVRLRELVGVLRDSGPTPQWEAQREQLRAIGNSIQQLEQKDVPVPEDLRKLKNKLEGGIRNAEKQQVILFFLKEQLSQILDEVGAAVQKGSFNGTT